MPSTQLSRERQFEWCYRCLTANRIQRIAWRVLLLDCDQRRPGLSIEHAILNPDAIMTYMGNSHRRSWILVIVVCLAVSVFCVAYPIYVIRPFRAQQPRELLLALEVTRFRGVITIFCALAAIAAAIRYLRSQPRTFGRVFAFSAAFAACIFAGLARVNIFEQLMFHPLSRPEFERATHAKIEPDDKLMVVKVNGVARAYPIRTMGYHHVVNDEVGGAALVATY